MPVAKSVKSKQADCAFAKPETSPTSTCAASPEAGADETAAKKSAAAAAEA